MVERGRHRGDVAERWRGGGDLSRHHDFVRQISSAITGSTKKLRQNEYPTDYRVFKHCRVAGRYERNSNSPWSGAFVSWALQRAGVDAPKSAAIHAFQNWGDALQEPKLGCLVLIGWGDPTPRHIGFLLMDLGDTVLIVAGNTQDSVRVQAVAKKYVLEYRMPTILSLGIEIIGKASQTISAKRVGA